MKQPPPIADLSITVHRVPSWFSIAMTVAPLVRRGVISDAEGRMLVSLRYAIKSAELADV